MYPVLDIIVEKGEQTHWINDEIRKLHKETIAALSPMAIEDTDYNAWLLELADKHPDQLHAVLSETDLPAMRKHLSEDEKNVMGMLDKFKHDEEILPGVESYSAYWERIFMVSYKEENKDLYWSLVRLTAYASIPWLYVRALRVVQDDKMVTKYTPEITGLTSENFAEPGHHDIRAAQHNATLAPEFQALGVRETPEDK